MLTLWHLRAVDGASRPPLAAGVAHGVTGLSGLVALLFCLGGPPRGVDAGVGSFGTISAVLFIAAGLTGIVILTFRRNAVMMAIHAGIAIIGYVLLLAWNSLGQGS